MSARRALVARDQDVTAFSATLDRLCDATAALGAAFVDPQGETVDYAGSLESFQIRVAAAEARLLLDTLERSSVLDFASTHELTVSGTRGGVVAVPMSEGYAVVLLVPRRCFGVSRRAVAEAVRELSHEAGFDPPAWSGGERWERVELSRPAKRGARPEALWWNGAWRKLEILGRYGVSAHRSRETGYRARLEGGAEITLVRERTGVWYASDLPERPRVLS
jgi:hypothetical protein